MPVGHVLFYNRAASGSSLYEHNQGVIQMSFFTNKAARSQLPPVEMTAHFGSHSPTCRKCRSNLVIHDIQIYLGEEVVDPRFPKDDGDPPLRHNRVDLSMYCRKCNAPSNLIVMPADENGTLDYYHED